jgi:hypothetical protein
MKQQHLSAGTGIIKGFHAMLKEPYHKRNVIMNI